MIIDQLSFSNINKSNFSGHNCEHFFVYIFGAIENILSAGTDDDF